MIKLKKRLLLLTILFIFLFSFSASAANGFEISAGNNFLVLNENASEKEISDAFGMEEQELKSYISANGIIYLAVNENNTKQIRLSSSKNSFSEEIENLSSLIDEDITALSAELMGEEATQTEIITKGAQKFLKASLSLSDSGGNYTLTKYVTVAQGKNYTLSFYTSKGENSEYIEEVFKTFTCDDFLKESNTNQNKFLLLIIIASAVAVFILFTFLRDYLKSKKE